MSILTPSVALGAAGVRPLVARLCDRIAADPA